MKSKILNLCTIFSLSLLPLWGQEENNKEAEKLFTGEPEIISKGHQFAEGMAFDSEGNYYFTDVPARKLYKVDAKTGKKELFDEDSGRANGIAMGPDGKLYGACGGDQKIYQWDLKTGKKVAVAEGSFSNDIAITKTGHIYFTDPKTSSVWSVSPPPERKLSKAVALPWRPNGIGLNPKHDGLYVAEFLSDKVHRFPINADGNLGKSKPAYKLATNEQGQGQLDGMVVLPSGNLLIGTSRGIQLVPPIDAKDANGPVIQPVVVPPFGARPRCNYVRLSPDGKWLYAAFKDDIVRLSVREGAIK